MRHHELGIINRKPPLQWCTKLRFIENSGDSNDRTIQPHNRLQTFPGHFIKQRIAIPPSATLTHNYYSFNRNHITSHNANNNSHSAQSSNSDYRKSSDLITNNKKRFDDSYKTEQEQEQQQEHENEVNNEIYKFITEPWPSGRHTDDTKSKNLFNNINNKNNDNLASEKRARNNQYSAHSSSLTALVSFPGSGNTWLRYLLQQSTGKLKVDPIFDL